MKRLFVVAVMILGLLSVGMASANTAMAGWHDLTQDQRNQAIVNRAFNDLYTYQGSCKVWAQNVVWSASSNAVWLPTTIDPPGCFWNYSSYVISVSTNIRYVLPGQILQMHLKSGNIHTAIVSGVYSNGVVFIESNWFGDGYVNLRYVSFTDFENQVGCFSVNYVL